VLTELEKTVRAKLRWTLQGRGSVADRGSNASAQLRELLVRGLQVLHHHPNGRIIQSYIQFNQEDEKLVVRPMEKSIFDFSKKTMVRSLLFSILAATWVSSLAEILTFDSLMVVFCVAGNSH
jgi:hypothetical protein